MLSASGNPTVETTAGKTVIVGEQKDVFWYRARGWSASLADGGLRCVLRDAWQQLWVSGKLAGQSAFQ